MTEFLTAASLAGTGLYVAYGRITGVWNIRRWPHEVKASLIYIWLCLIYYWG